MGAGVAFLMMALAWAAVVIWAATIPGPSGAPRSQGEIAGFLSWALLIDLPITYVALACVFGTTRIEANGTRISSKSRPLPIAKSVRVDAPGVKQFFAMPRTSQGLYSIYVMDANDHAHRLSGSLPSPFAAHQICRELNDYYGLKELPVHGVNHLPAGNVHLPLNH